MGRSDGVSVLLEGRNAAPGPLGLMQTGSRVDTTRASIISPAGHTIYCIFAVVRLVSCDDSVHDHPLDAFAVDSDVV